MAQHLPTTLPLRYKHAALLGALLFPACIGLGMRSNQKTPLAPDQWIGVAIATFLGAPIGAGLALAHRRAKDTPRLAKAVSAGLALMSIVATCDGYFSARTARRFLAEVDSTTGVVFATHPEDHNQITVDFHVAGRTIRVKAGAPGLARDLAQGSVVSVYYPRSRPEKASFELPDPNFVDALAALPAIWILGLIWLLGIGGSIFGARWRQPSSSGAT